MKFFIENSWLIGLVLISGGMLIIPVLQRRGAKVSLFEATQLINQNKTTVLDVRGGSEFESGHIQGAKNVPLTELTGRLKELEKQKPHPIVVVCASGTRSSAAVATLTKSGFMGAVSLDGGISAWQSQGLPVVK